jgi:hypothetical protein
MTADIISFPQKQIKTSFDCKYQLDTEELTNSKYTIKGKPVVPPANQEDYLKICKRFMDETEYKIVLLGILDSEYFEKARPELKNIIACYYEIGDKR